MNEAELRARIRALVQSGVLPRILPPPMRLEPRQPAPDIERILVGHVADALCSACDEPHPVMTYRYPDGRAIRLHTRCGTIWAEERQRV